MQLNFYVTSLETFFLQVNFALLRDHNSQVEHLIYALYTPPSSSTSTHIPHYLVSQPTTDTHLISSHHRDSFNDWARLMKASVCWLTRMKHKPIQSHGQTDLVDEREISFNNVVARQFVSRSSRAPWNEHDNPFNFLAFCSTCTCIVFVSHYTWLRRLYSEKQRRCIPEDSCSGKKNAKESERNSRRRQIFFVWEANCCGCSSSRRVSASDSTLSPLDWHLTNIEFRHQNEILDQIRELLRRDRTARRELATNTIAGDTFSPSPRRLYNGESLLIYGDRTILSLPFTLQRRRRTYVIMFGPSCRPHMSALACCCLERRKVLSRFRSPPDCCGSASLPARATRKKISQTSEEMLKIRTWFRRINSLARHTHTPATNLYARQAASIDRIIRRSERLRHAERTLLALHGHKLNFFLPSPCCSCAYKIVHMRSRSCILMF